MPPHTPTTVVIGRFDDLLAGGLRELIDGDPSLAIAAADVEHRRIPVVLRAHRPDVAILDAGALARLAEVRDLSTSHPTTRLVLLAENPSMVECAQLLAFGASACLGRSTQSRDVLNAIHLASRGLQVIPRSPSESAGHSFAGRQLLTPREAEVLPLLHEGSSNAQIALALHVSVETIRTHARNIYRKLGVSSRRELAAPPTSDPRRETAPPPTLNPERETDAARSPRRQPTRSPPRARRGHGLRHD